MKETVAKESSQREIGDKSENITCCKDEKTRSGLKQKWSVHVWIGHLVNRKMADR